MRSIRLSLILYFLLLLGAALGGVSYFCYESTQEALAAKETSTRKLWEKQYDENRRRLEAEYDTSCQRTAADFDAKTEILARALADKLVWYQHRVEGLYGLGALGLVGNDPGNAFSHLLSLNEATLLRNVNRLGQLRADYRLQHPHSDDETFPPVVGEGQYFQTYIMVPKPGMFPPPPPRGEFPPPPKGDPMARLELVNLEASESLGGPIWRLDKEQKRKADEGHPPFDNVPSPSGRQLRRVAVKIQGSLTRRGIVVEPEVHKWFPMLPKPGEEQTLAKWRSPPIYLQFARDTGPRDAALALLLSKLKADNEELLVNLHRDLAALREDLEDARAELRTRLLWIGLGSFAALLVGGFFVVRLSLSPLNRLSDAVSQVSEKDFRLPIDESKLPSELQPIAGRLTETLEQLKRAFGREKQAAADISHELRTPVAALLTRLEIALRKPRSAEEYREVLLDCRDSGQQMHQLVERLLALARLDAGADLLRPRDVDVNGLVDQCAALVRPLAEARGLRLSVLHNGPTMLHADPDKLREVLTNLLHNAIEYNKPDGAIEVKVERNNGHLHMEVSDTGIGIAPEARKHIFERFFRADPSRQADSPHAGLGLAIVKGYVDLMGGAIDVDSTMGAGSTFRVRLPVEE
jgi:heavy metal sensor kinase